MAKRFGSGDGVITPYEEKVGKKIAEATGNEYKKGGRAKNTKRMNRLEELGRVDAEKAYTRKGKRNLKLKRKELFDLLTREALQYEATVKKSNNV